MLSTQHFQLTQVKDAHTYKHMTPDETNDSSVAGQLFSTLVVQALQGLQQLAAYDNNPDMVDDTFLLISRGVRYSPGVVYNTHMLPIIVDAAMTGVLVQHRSAKISGMPALIACTSAHTQPPLTRHTHTHTHTKTSASGLKLSRMAAFSCVDESPANASPSKV